MRMLSQRGPQLLTLGLLAVLALAFRAIQFAALTSQIQWGYDFSFYWTAALHLLHSEPIYSAAQLAGPYAPQGQVGFLYPPPLAGFIEPLAALFPSDYRAAAWLWFAIGATILVASVQVLRRSERLADRFPLLAGRGKWFVVAGALAFPPVVGELVLGNVHLELLGLLTLAWLGVRRGTHRSEWLAGVAVGVAAVIKVFPGVLLLWFVLSGRPRAALGVVVGAVAVSLLALPLTGVQPWFDFPTVLANLSAPVDPTDTLAPTVWLSSLVSFSAARVIVTVAGLAILAWSAWAIRGDGAAATTAAPPPDAQPTDATQTGSMASIARSFAAAVVVAVLISPAVYQHYLALLVLPLLLGLGAGVPLRYLAVGYFLMWGGKQDALGDLAWIVNRAFPTVGALVLLTGFLVPRSSQRQVTHPVAATT
jgi:alpha-1,2-mannosyltransferase